MSVHILLYSNLEKKKGTAAPLQEGGRQDRTTESGGENSQAAPGEKKSNTPKKDKEKGKSSTNKLEGRESITTEEEKAAPHKRIGTWDHPKQHRLPSHESSCWSRTTPG